MRLNHKARSAIVILAGLLPALMAAGHADAATRARARGTVESLDGSTLKLKTLDGKEFTVTLSPDWSARGRYKVTAADIKPGDFVGIASQATDSGVNGALEVVVFPASMKGTGEGDRPWFAKPNSSMTNATVTSAVKSVDGPTLTLTYKGGEKKISISEGTPIVTLGPATKDQVKAGASVLVSGDSTGDTTITSKMVEVDETGPLPATN
jgi:hypothetical protein